MTHSFQATVTARNWWDKHQHAKRPTIRIQVGDHFVIIPIEQARRIVDEVHDLCDEHDRKTRTN